MAVTSTAVQGANGNDYLNFEESLRLEYAGYAPAVDDKLRIREIWVRLVHDCYRERHESRKLIKVGAGTAGRRLLAVPRDAHVGIIQRAVTQLQQELMARALAAGPRWPSCQSSQVSRLTKRRRTRKTLCRRT